MIYLDTNYLIGLLVRNSAEANAVQAWLEKGESLATSAIAWAEFLNGPVSPGQIREVETILQDRITPFGKASAALAARLFNETGRRRGSRMDCFIAAVALLEKASLATQNEKDFLPFAAHGLELATSPAT